ncbi:MAG: pilus assembly PilX family protein [Planctomycetota bacterium]|jgi:hypothetical protein
METTRKVTVGRRRGAVLLLSMIFVMIFSALAVSFAAFSGANVQLATNQQKVSQALATAESGLEVTRYWLDGIYVPSIVAESQRFQYISDYFQGGLDYYGITNIVPTYSTEQIVIPAVTIDSTKNLTFEAIVDKISNDVLQLEVTGHYGNINRKIRVQYGFYQRGNPIFDYGIASKGPLALEGKVDLSGANVAVESSVYIEAIGEPTALTLEGACSIAGDVSIVDPDAAVIVGDTSSIGGETGQAAIDNHVFRNAPPADFPVPNPGYFEQYIEDGNDHVITGDVASNITIQNVRIPPNTNPTFSGNVTIRGVIYIEQPNTVTFTGDVDIIGMIVADGNYEAPLAENSITFEGSVFTQSIENLPATEEFSALKEEKGTFMMAPGFSVNMGGSFETINGTICANGINFYGQAGGIIEGSVINYSDTPMTLSGNSDLIFNRSGTIEVPAGFEPELRLDYNPDSYSEVF